MAATSSSKSARTALALDADLWKVPYEKLKRDARDRKALITSLQGVSNKVAKLSQNPGEADTATKALQNLQAQLQQTKQQADEISAAEAHALDTCVQRHAHLRAVLAATQNGAIEWNQLRLPRLIVDYLLRQGCFKAAKELSQHLGCDALCEWPVFEAAQSIVQSLRDHNCQAALAWCSTHSARLKKLDSSLMFRLRIQEYVQLLQAQRTGDALQYARTHLQPYAHAHADEFKTAFALLVMSPDTQVPRYRRLLGPERWNELASLFLEDLLRVHSLSPVPMLELQLQAGLTALKCPLSYEEGCTKEDPMHLPEMRVLAQDLPWAKHGTSKVVCALSKAVMDDNNPPMMLPNGYVYSKQALTKLAAQHGGFVTCPVTGDSYRLQACDQVYIM